MSYIRQFPVPSDRMGILWSTLPVQDIAVIEYGPAGTTHYGAEIIGDLDIPINENLFCTHVDENDVVMGDTTRLERAIIEVDEKYEPACICVVGSSLTSVIAADITGVCFMLQPQIKAKLLPFEHGGFRGEYTLGIKDGLSALVKTFAKPGQQKENTYTVVGACYDSYRMESDLQEIKRMMKECFQMQALCTLPMASSVGDIKKSAGAECVLSLRKESDEAADYLHELGAGPVISQAPYGYKGTLMWADKIAEAVGKEVNPKFAERLEKKMERAKLSGKQIRFSGLPTQAVIEGGLAVILGIGTFLNEELGFTVTGILCHDEKNFSPLPSWIKHYKENDKLELLGSCKNTLVLGSDCTLQEVDSSNSVCKISFPTLQGITYATHVPFMGERGTDFIMESVLTYYNSLIKRMMMN